MILSHNPHGSGHPYRYDLDQRVPVLPLVGERFEIRIIADSAVTGLRVLFENGSVVLASVVETEQLVQEHGPQAAGQTAAGHLATAAEGRSSAATQKVWVARTEVTSDQKYSIQGVRDGTQIELSGFAVEPASWSSGGGTIAVSGDSQRLDPNSIEWLVGSTGPHRVRFRLRLDPGQHIAGLGERYGSIDQRGKILDAVVFEQYKHQGDRTYLPVPMAVVVGGKHWGFHLATTRRSWYDLAKSDPNWITIEAEVDPSSPALDLGLWAGEPHTIVQHFLNRTGRPQKPPACVFEPWMSGNEWNTQARVEAEVARGIAKDIPVGVIVIEAWSDESTFVAFRDAEYEVNEQGDPHRLADFSFPADGAWPDPVGMVERLHEAGIRVLLWQIPVVPTDRGNDGQVAADLAALERLDYCVRDAEGAPYTNRGWWFPGSYLPDFTNPAARRWWTAKRRYLLDEVGIDGFKTDGGEHLWGHDLVYADGTLGAETNNRFPVLYAQAYHELMRDAGVDGVTFSRAGFSGSAAFPCHWAGDEDSTWEAFRASIRAGLSAGIAGINYWGWDLAGFSGELPDAELYLRSVAMATFCPIMQYHSEFNHHQVPNVDRTPWNIAERNDANSVLDVYRSYAQLRQRLVPYLVEQAAASAESNRPLMRSLFFDHPDDEEAWLAPLQYQLGNDLLVAPITEPEAKQIRLYLPAGSWIDCYSGERHTGQTWVTRSVPLHEIAVYRRAASSQHLAGVFLPR